MYCNEKGSTLLETLFAFSIYITTIIVLMGLLHGLLQQYVVGENAYLNYLDTHNEVEKGIWREINSKLDLP